MRRPEHQFADGVGETTAGHGGALLFQPGRRFVVGGQQHVERRAVLDLGVERAGGAERQHRLVAGGFLEVRGDDLHGRGEVGGDGDLDLAGKGRESNGQQRIGGNQSAEACASLMIVIIEDYPDSVHQILSTRREEGVLLVWKFLSP